MLLDSAAVASYRRDGIYFPIRVMDAAQAGNMLSRLERTEAEFGGRLPARVNQKPHLLFPWLAELVRHPGILDAVESVLGPDLLCWSAQFFAKNGGDPGYVSWHQDATYWGLSSPDVVTAWVAFTPSTVQSGCMRVVPGTQHRQFAHKDTFAETNLLSRGQEIEVDVNESDAVDVILAPGEISLHHVLICHGSEPNRSSERLPMPCRQASLGGAAFRLTVFSGDSRRELGAVPGRLALDFRFRHGTEPAVRGGRFPCARTTC